MNTNRIAGVAIKIAKIKCVGFEDEQTITDLINGDFTIDKDLELTYADDKSGASLGFRLYKLKEQTQFLMNSKCLFFSFVLDEKNYSVVKLIGCKSYKRESFTFLGRYQYLLMFYNFNDGEQMVIETDLSYNSGSFIVKKYAIDDVLTARTLGTMDGCNL
jgi:hypothetical protein